MRSISRGAALGLVVALCVGLTAVAAGARPHILFIRTGASSGTSDIYSVSHNKNVRAVTDTRADESSVVASDDGRRIAFARGGHIYVARRDGSNVRRITSGRDFDDYPSWSPDGSQIAFFRSPGEIWIVRVRSGDERRLVGGRGGEALDPTWSPDGDTIAFRRSDFHLYAMPVEGGTITQLTSSTRWCDSAPDWDPRGSRLVFRRAAASGEECGPGDLWRIRPDGSHAIRLLRSRADEDFPEFSPSGRHVAFARSGAIFLLHIRNGDVERMTRPGRDFDTKPAWLPDR